MNLFVLGLRRSGTTILYDVLGEDSELQRFYEPLREEDETVGGGSGAREEDAFAATRAERRRFRDERFSELPIELFNWGGPRAPELELETQLPPHVRELLCHLVELAPNVAIKETRLHHKLSEMTVVDPTAAVVHLVRDPRAVCASMLLGRRRRLDLYPDADAFFTTRTERKLWSSRAISDELVRCGRGAEMPEDPPDFLRPLLVWRAATAAASRDGERLFDQRYALVRLEDLRSQADVELARIYALLDRDPPPEVLDWAREKIRSDSDLHLGDDPRWGRAARVLGMEQVLIDSGYGEVVELDDGRPLGLEPPAQRSRLAGFVGRARGRLR